MEYSKFAPVHILLLRYTPYSVGTHGAELHYHDVILIKSIVDTYSTQIATNSLSWCCTLPKSRP